MMEAAEKPPVAIERKWLPSEYMDESAPPARATPSDWIVETPDGARALATGDMLEPPDALGRIIAEGDEVTFYWTESYGCRELTFKKSPEGWIWSMDGDEPQASIGGDMLIAEEYNWESAMPTLAEFAEEYSKYDMKDGETITIKFYAWSTYPTPFVFSSGTFHLAQ